MRRWGRVEGPVASTEKGAHQAPTEWGLQVASAPPRRQGEHGMADRTHVSVFERAEAPSRTEGGSAGSERRVPRSRARPGRQACGTILSTVPFSYRPLSGAGTGDGPKTGPPDRRWPPLVPAPRPPGAVCPRRLAEQTPVRRTSGPERAPPEGRSGARQRGGENPLGPTREPSGWSGPYLPRSEASPMSSVLSRARFFQNTLARPRAIF